ncbi:MAG TPA: universal stress protein [Candidatus Acidoferrales bacterium]|nr:universal stress protein [Candidatus Acidoferrales bacterium]
MFETIVVATDASPASRAAVALALRLAKLDGSSVVFANVVDVAALMPLSGYDAPYPEEAIEVVQDESDRLLAQAQAAAGEAGVTSSVRSCQGNAAEELLLVAEREKAGLIVMGTHGRTGLARLFIGSVADAVLRRANVPVLVTREPSHV